jgi:hypothetical protein
MGNATPIFVTDSSADIRSRGHHPKSILEWNDIAPTNNTQKTPSVALDMPEGEIELHVWNGKQQIVPITSKTR